MIKYENVSLSYPGSGKAIDNINFEIEDGELFVIVGPSGSGKTTILKLINRLLRETEGQIFFDGADINSFDLRELRLNIGYVLQGIALFPNMTVAENIAIIPEMKNMNKADIIKRTDELLNEVGLDPDIYRDRLPSDLSGGEKQRIGILRAIIANPKVLLMDEPFSALDPISRRDLQDLIIDLQKSYKITTVFVTHDMSEALRVADRICIMQDGKIVQIGKGKEIIENPANKFVGQFFENESEYINE